ncbi:hypothetical protein KCU95_g17757, partial [Aureobasidium melanogenum]
MVVKWSSEKDQFILCHILEDKGIKISNDVLDSMIAAWPSSFGDPPTRKAFTEHFSKIRKTNKAIAGGAATAPNTPTVAAAKKRKTPASKTPAKRKAQISSDSDNEETPLPKKTPAKRRKNIAAEDSDEDMEKEMKDLGVKVKNEPVDEEDSPTKKPARRTKAEVQYAESDDGEASHPEDADEEYVDKQVVAHMTAYLNTPDTGDEGAEV